MVKLNLEIDGENKTYDIPTQWDDVTVDKFIEIVKLDEKKDINDLEKVMELMNILTTIPKDDVELLPVESFMEIQNNFSFVKTDVDKKMKDSIVIDGEEYFVKNDFNDLTMGESITIETLLKEADNPMYILDKMLCLFLRKKKENGKLESFKTTFLTDRIDIFRKAPITEVYNNLIFFSNGVDILENNMKDFLVEK
jgi:hypothetical protein